MTRNNKVHLLMKALEQYDAKNYDGMQRTLNDLVTSLDRKWRTCRRRPAGTDRQMTTCEYMQIYARHDTPLDTCWLLLSRRRGMPRNWKLRLQIWSGEQPLKPNSAPTPAGISRRTPAEE